KLMGAPWGSHCRGTLFSVIDRCSGLFPSLSDPARRSALCLKVALVVLHLFFAGTIFFFDKDLIKKTKREPWYTASYALLFAATLVQYFVTSRSSPGYVHDAQKAVEEQDALARRISSCSKTTSFEQKRKCYNLCGFKELLSW
ncbi:zinc finger family protein, partial [Genlisea aurea]